MSRSFSANLAANLYSQLSLLSEPPSGPNGAGSYHDSSLGAQKHSLITTPIFTATAGLFVDKNCPFALNQYGLLGRALELVDPDTKKRGNHENGDYENGYSGGARRPEKNADPRVFLNGNAPWSAFICGLQGSGKSHTLACMLENMLLQSPTLGNLPNPLTAIVFHFDVNNSANALRPCEAAYLATHMPVRILVSSSNYPQMSRLYGGIASENLIVKPLKLRQSDLNIERMLSLMSVDKNSDHPPLYMEYVRKILRELATASSIYGSGFDYALFREMIMNADLTPMQKGPLTLRLEILESFLEMKEGAEEVWDFSPGVLTIVDLSDPFVDEASACALFDICVGLFLEKDVKYGRVIALDEAHKYMTATSPAQKLTDNLLSVIRQQRHLATRVLISTQEPTISPKLLDLCNVIIAHRFTSPEWLSFMKRHLAAVAVESESNTLSLLERIVALNEGEAYLFAPAGIVSSKDFEPGYNQAYADGEDGGEEGDEYGEEEEVRKLGLGYLKVKVRKRLTEDGGKSILANSTPVAAPTKVSGSIPPDVMAAMVNKREGTSRGGRGGRGGRFGDQGGRGGGGGGQGRQSAGWQSAPPQQQQPQQQQPQQQKPQQQQPQQQQPQQQQPQQQKPQQQNGVHTNGQNNSWDRWESSPQQQPQQQGTWDPNHGIQNGNSSPKTAKNDTAPKPNRVARKKAFPATAAKTSNGTNGSNTNGGAPLPKQLPQQQPPQQQGGYDPNEDWK